MAGAKLKRTTKEVSDYFNLQGCELLDEYTGCMDLMEYRCHCGNYSEISWNNFTKGKRCGHCVKWGLKKKRTIEQVKQMFQERGAEFLDEEFKGVHHKHRYRCKCGREAEITLAGFHHQKQDCKQCGLDKNKGEGHHCWKSDREKHRLEHLFRKKIHKALRSSLQAMGKTKVGKSSDLLGYTPKQLQEHITSHPDWESVKDHAWDMDHIFPIKAFMDHGIYDLKIINALNNLRPMERKANEFKGSKYDKSEFLKWLSQ